MSSGGGSGSGRSGGDDKKGGDGKASGGSGSSGGAGSSGGGNIRLDPNRPSIGPLQAVIAGTNLPAGADRALQSVTTRRSDHSAAVSLCLHLHLIHRRPTRVPTAGYKLHIVSV